MRRRLLSIAVFLPAFLQGQYYNISTIAGAGKFQFTTGLQAVNARLVEPRLIATDGTGNAYVTDSYYHQVFQITPAGGISVYAGNGTAGFSGDGGQATAAQLNFPQGIAVDSSGNVYIADTGNFRVRKVTPTGVISTVALINTGVTCVAADSAGNLYATSANSVVKITSSGAVSTFAGTSAAGFTGDGGPATAAQLYAPYGIHLDSSGNVYVADQANNRIRKINTQGVITTFAGSAQGGFHGDGGSATSAQLFYPSDMILDGQGNMYIADTLNMRVRLVNSSGTITTYAGGGTSLNDGSVIQALLDPVGLAFDNSGNLLLSEFNYREVRKIASQNVTTIAGMLPTSGSGDNGAATSAYLLQPLGVAVDGSNNVLISDYVDNRIRRVTPQGVITTVIGNGIPGYQSGVPASSAEIGAPNYLSLDKSGDIFYAVGTIQEISATTGTVATVAGNGAGFSGDGGPATQALLLGPSDAVADAAGNLYIADKGNNRIRKVTTSGIIETIAGDGKPGFSGDGASSQNAEIYQPYQMALDASGNLFFADWGNSRVREITTGGVIKTVAGGGAGALGDGGPATAATVGGNLTGVALDAAGNLYIATFNRIRKVDAVTGIISTIAGNGTSGFTGDGGLASNAEINGATGVAVDSSGNVYLTDTQNYRVRKLAPAQIVKEGVVNGATFQAGGVAPGEIVTIFAGPGVTLGPAKALGIQLTSAGLVSNNVGGVQVTFDNHPAALIYVSAGQLNVVVPYEVAGQTSTVLQVTFNGTPTNTVTLPVVAASPGVFAITNVDGTVNSPGNPAPAGGAVVLYGTGEGQTTPGGIDGGVNSASYPKPVLSVTSQVAGQNAQILYAGAAPDFVAGVLQVDVQIPAGVHGTVPITLSVGTAAAAQTLMISVQ